MVETKSDQDQVRKRLRRLNLSLGDLFEARDFVRLALESDFFDAKPGDQGSVIIRALTTATIIAYGRPFKRSPPTGQYAAESKLDLAILDGLDEQMIAIHERLITLRDKEFAHTDPDHAELAANIFQVPGNPDVRVSFPISRATRMPLSRGEFQDAWRLIGELITRVSTQIEYPCRILPVGYDYGSQ